MFPKEGADLRQMILLIRLPKNTKKKRFSIKINYCQKDEILQFVIHSRFAISYKHKTNQNVTLKIFKMGVLNFFILKFTKSSLTQTTLKNVSLHKILAFLFGILWYLFMEFGLKNEVIL